MSYAQNYLVYLIYGLSINRSRITSAWKIAKISLAEHIGHAAMALFMNKFTRFCRFGFDASMSRGGSNAQQDCT
jgi:hypothetical protein